MSFHSSCRQHMPQTPVVMSPRVSFRFASAIAWNPEQVLICCPFERLRRDGRDELRQHIPPQTSSCS
jgi:hypothetical protein